DADTSRAAISTARRAVDAHGRAGAPGDRHRQRISRNADDWLPDRLVGGFAATVAADLRLARTGCGGACAGWSRRRADAVLDRWPLQHRRDVHAAGSAGTDH